MPGGASCFAEEKPMVRCMTPHKGDRMDMGGMPNNITNKLEISQNKHLIEGNDPRLFIFAGNEHKQIENRWDWMVGCFGINPPCSKSCEQTLFDCMDSSNAEIGKKSGVKEGVTQFSRCMFSLKSPCSECAPTLEMLKRSQFPEYEKFNNFGAPIPPTEHKRSNESKCAWENVYM